MLCTPSCLDQVDVAPYSNADGVTAVPPSDRSRGRFKVHPSHMTAESINTLRAAAQHVGWILLAWHFSRSDARALYNFLQPKLLDGQMLQRTRTSAMKNP